MSRLRRSEPCLPAGRKMYTQVHLALRQPPTYPRPSRLDPPAFPQRRPLRWPSQQASLLVKSKDKSFDLLSSETVCFTREALVCNGVTSFLCIYTLRCAGTGKSVLLREIIRTLRKRHAKTHDAVAITASTGAPTCRYF